ncbi:MAG: hypothetical protein U0169_27685 [Polyangiaceae bacterium]
MTTFLHRIGFPFSLALFLGGCGGAAARGPVVAEMEGARGAPLAKDASSLAPTEFARAERIRKDALDLADSGDVEGADLTARRATAAYGRAALALRKVRATRADADADVQKKRVEGQLAELVATRATIDREADELDKKLVVVRALRVPASSGKADATREAARLVAARSLAVQARLLCGATRMLDAKTTGLDAAEAELDALGTKLEGKPASAPIDEVARARATCLALLTRARRATADDAKGASDTLLAELAQGAGWDPVRDERGVVVVLRNVWSTSPSGLTKDAETKLAELGRVANAHPSFAVQVVVHSKDARSKAELDVDRKRAEAAAKILATKNAAIAPTSFAVGANAPLVDPADAKNRARNERVEVVFVSRTD